MPIRLGAALIYGAALSLSGADLLDGIARTTSEHGGASGGIAFAAYAVVIKIAMALGNGGLAFLLDGYSANEHVTIAALVVIHVGGAICCTLAWRRSSMTSPGAVYKNLRTSPQPSIADRAGQDAVGEAL